ncbi:hypothetical protein [Niastella vici]|nr:hypothetical protein [Niastella vici]
MTSDKKAGQKLFSTSYNELKIDSKLYDVVYSNGYFFISQASQKVVVLDTFFRRQQQIEDSINKFPSTIIYKTNDSVILCKYDGNRTGFPETYYLTNDFKLKAFKEKIEYSQMPGELLFEDSLYKIFANRIGQDGFFTYFLEKSTKIIFAIFSYSPRQVLKFQEEYYIICDGRKHDSTNIGVIKIKNPKQLFEITIQQAEKLNILYTHLAASPGKQYEALADTIKKWSFNSYGYLDRYSVPIYTFQKGNELFTIVKNDSSIYLGKHEGNNFQKVQQLFDTAFGIDNIYPMKYKNNTLVIFSSSGGKMSYGQMVDYFDCGFFNIEADKIDLYRLYREHKSKWQ